MLDCRALGSVDEALRLALEPVLHDLRTAAIAPPRIEEHDWTGDPASPSVMVWSPDGSGHGVSVERASPQVERIASVADQVQEWVIEELWDHAPTNWPPCPWHPANHPLSAATRGGKAVWVCPTDATSVFEIGTL